MIGKQFVDANKAIECEWCIGIFKGKQAELIKNSSDVGTGYVIKSESGRGVNYEVTAAFRRPVVEPTPEHLQVATMSQSEKLEIIRKRRSNLHAVKPANSLGD